MSAESARVEGPSRWVEPRVGRGDPRMERTPWLSRYGVAVLVVIATVGVLTIPGFGQGLGNLLFLAVLISAWYGGLGPGLLAATLFAIAGVRALLWSGQDLSSARIAALVPYLACAV